MSSVPPSDNDPFSVSTRPMTAELADRNPKPEHQNALPVGTVVGEFEIRGLVGQGGFGIVYLAYDHSLRREVALKEYMPASLAERGDGSSVIVKSERYNETFQAGLRSFVNEARLLAQFDHPSLVKVYRFWESHGTAYMVMPLYKGVTLEEKLSRMGGPPDEAWLKRVLAQLLEALNVIHVGHCLHRDIAPDNILILADERPLLLDFGAARKVIGDMTQALTVILKPGYAPVEQYANDPTMKQGAWTDIYALAAVIYFAITGHAPMPSVGRIISDSLIPLSKAAAGRYSTKFLNAIDRALSVKPEDRPQNIGELRALLGFTSQTEDEYSRQGPHAQAATGPKKRASALYIAIFVMTVAAIGLGVFLSKDRSAATPEAKTDIASNLRLPAPIIDEKQFDPLKALDEIFERRDRNHAVTVSTEKAQTQIGRDALRFSINSGRTGYVYVLMVGTNNSDFFLLFPNAVDKNNYIKAGEQLDLPRPKWKMIAEGPPGTDHFVVIISDRPRDFVAAGLKAIDPFSEFPPGQAARLYGAHTGPTPLFAGKAICSGQTSNCSESYGAAVFSIEEIQGPMK